MVHSSWQQLMAADFGLLLILAQIGQRENLLEMLIKTGIFLIAVAMDNFLLLVYKAADFGLLQIQALIGQSEDPQAMLIKSGTQALAIRMVLI